MPRGGYRPGAGRKPRVVDMKQFDVTSKLNAMLRGRKDPKARAAAALAAYGMSSQAISAVMRIDNLETTFADELAFGRVLLACNVLAAQYEAALRGNVGAQNALLKRAGIDCRQRPCPRCGDVGCTRRG